MSSDPGTVLDRYWNEFWNAGDERLAAELLAEDFASDDPALAGLPPGRTIFVKQVYDRFRAAFPDMKIHVREQLTSGTDRVVCAWTASGTHHGEFDGRPPTGRSFSVDGISIVRVTDGRIADHITVWDMHGLEAQLDSAGRSDGTEAP